MESILAETKVKLPHWGSELARVALPLGFVALVAAAVAGVTSPLFFAMVLSAGLVIVVIRALFPAGRLFPIAFASLIAVYAAIFSLFCRSQGATGCTPAAVSCLTCGSRDSVGVHANSSL